MDSFQKHLLSGIIQTLKTTYCMIPLMWQSGEGKEYRDQVDGYQGLRIGKGNGFQRGRKIGRSYGTLLYLNFVCVCCILRTFLCHVEGTHIDSQLNRPGFWAVFFLTTNSDGLFAVYMYFFNWGIAALQYCVGFCHTSTWISHRYTYVPSLLNLFPTSQHIPPL